MKDALLLAGCLMAASILHAADWPQYRGPLGDGVAEESISKINWNKQPPRILWKVPTPLGFSSFAVANGRAFTLIAEEKGGEKVEACLALDANTGKELWNMPLGASEYGHDGGNAGARGNQGGDGPRSTPATDGDFVYVYDAHLVLSCFEAATGKVVWKREIQREFGGRDIKWLNATSPILKDEVVYVSGGGAGQAFLAFDKASGELLWKSGTETITHATPQFANLGGKPQVIYFVQSGLVSVDAQTGKELWRSKFPFNVSTAASPVVDGNRVYCSAGYSVGAQVVEVSPELNAEKLWFKPNQLMNHWSTPIAKDGFLYGIYEFKKYGRAPLNCVEVATGEIKWSQRGFGPGNCILAGDTLVVLSDAGEVVLAKATPERYEELGRIQAVKGKCWSTPALSDGRIYVRSTEEAACILVE